MDTEEIMETQDQPLFVCETEINAKYQEEASKAASQKTAMIMDSILYGFCLLMAGFLVVDSIMNQRWKQNAFMLVVVALAVVYTIFAKKRAPKKALQRWEEAIIRKYGSASLHLTTEFYALSLAQTLKEDEEQFIGDGYSSIDELKESEHLLLLRHGKNQYYFVSKDGFTKGTAEEFRQFITERIGGK